MVHYRYPSGGRLRRAKRRNHFVTAALVAISMSPVAYYANLQDQSAAPAAVEAPKTIASPAPAREATVIVATGEDVRVLMDPKPAFGAKTHTFTHTFAQNTPLATAFSPLPGQRETQAAPVQVAAVPPPAPAPEVKMAQAVVPPVPLPVPRPAEFRIQKPAEPVKVANAPPAPVRTAALPSTPDGDAPSFFEKFFGVKPATPPESALSYAAVNTGSIAPSSRLSASPSLDEATAVYDISANVVIMPNGERLEAHSGLGDKRDDPRYVNVRMKGATPPGTYILKEREALFHGVRAIRLNPVGGSAAIYGRDGILAHTYMLGPNGDSNGCVSFKDYNKFLQAYLRGEVKRLVVTAGSKQDLLPRMAGSRRTVF